MKEISYKQQKEKYLSLLQTAEDLLSDGVDPDDIVEYLNDKKEEELSRAFPFYGLFCGFLSANMAWKISTNYRLFGSWWIFLSK